MVTTTTSFRFSADELALIDELVAKLRASYGAHVTVSRRTAIMIAVDAMLEPRA
jgi:hypothetical protein